MTSHRHLLTLAAAGAALALVAGCGSSPGDDEPTATGTTTQAPPSATETSAEPSATASETETGHTDDDIGEPPAFGTDTADVSSEASGEPDLLLVDVRAAEHDDFDRVVLEFAGTGTPGWRAGYTDDPVQEGSGNPIDLEGDADLQIFVSNTRYPDEGETYWEGPNQFETEGEEVEEINVPGTFEGETQAILGIDSEGAPFRVFALTGPVRVVIDVQHVDD